MATVYLALGSNLGNRHQNIYRAVQALEDSGVVIEKRSSMIETEPEGGPPQTKYINAVLKGTTDLQPHELLVLTKQIERDMGRVKTTANGPRMIDIDILLYDSLHIKSDTLIIPHPRMTRREFVMQPLREIDPRLAQELCDAPH